MDELKNKRKSFEIGDECRPFIDNSDILQEAYGSSAFHDSVVSHLEYKLSDDGVSSDIYLDLSIDGEVETVLRFIKVHGIEINLPDIRSSFFYRIDFYMDQWCDYGNCIVMETDGDLVKIVAEKIVVLQ